jgi:hypothetical protein
MQHARLGAHAEHLQLFTHKITAEGSVKQPNLLIRNTSKQHLMHFKFGSQTLFNGCLTFLELLWQ